MIVLLEIGELFLIAAGIGAFIPVVGAVLFVRDTWRSTVPTFCALALIGSAVGVAGGMSRIGVVGDIVPAVLGLLGVVAVYLFGIDRSKGVIASIGAVALAISFVSSYALASQFRGQESSDPRGIRSICAEAYSNPALIGNPVALENFENKLGWYCERVMSWHIPNSSGGVCKK